MFNALLFALFTDSAVSVRGAIPTLEDRQLIYAIEATPGKVHVAAELFGRFYKGDDLLKLYARAGAEWRPEYAGSPELVGVFETAFDLSGERTRQASLHAPAEWSRRLASKAPSHVGDWATAMERRSLRARFQIGPYALLLHTIGNGASSYLRPLPMRKIGDAWRLVPREYPLNEPANLLVELTPALDPRGRSRYVGREELQGLVAFELHTRAPEGPLGRTDYHFRWNETPPEARPGEVRVYADAVAEPALGYGLPIRELASGGGNEARLAQLLQRTWSVQDPRAAAPAWHSRYATEFERAGAKGSVFPGRYSIHPDARLLGSIDCGVAGSVFFVVNPAESSGPASSEDLGSLVDVALVEEDGRAVLADNFLANGPREGLLYQVFWSPSFKVAFLEWIAAERPTVAQRLQEAH